MGGGKSTGGSPRGLRRLALRAPIRLYRMGLGWVFGERFLLLTHTGRKSGRERQTVLEVVARSRVARAYIVASGWGERADWFQNITQRSQVRIEVGGRKLAAQARRLLPAEAAQILIGYSTRHPTAFRALSRVMLGEPIAPDAAGCARLAEHVPLVALSY